ncbi:MAG: MFS transporter [Lachnospiraceae bacterium]
MKWFKKSNLDEMQELKLLKLESKGFWIGFLGLFVAIAAQTFLYGPENMRHILAGEFIVLMCMGVYLIGGCVYNGIWDKHLPATPAVNIGLSILAAAITALFNAVLSYRNYADASTAIIVFVVSFFLLSVGISVIICIASALYHRRKNRLEKENPDDAG